MTQLTQDEIVSSTKTVISGLESLKIEHHAGLQAAETNIKSGSQDSSGDTVLSSEKSDILRKSLDMIDIGIEEAKVSCGKSTALFIVQWLRR
jgi:kinesin light chain